jgi:hypothetical protein
MVVGFLPKLSGMLAALFRQVTKRPTMSDQAYGDVADTDGADAAAGADASVSALPTIRAAGARAARSGVSRLVSGLLRSCQGQHLSR